MGQHKSRLSRRHKPLHRAKMKGGAMAASFNVNSLIDTPDCRCVTPLWLAVRYNDLDVAEALIQAGADVNLACGRLQMTPLHLASYNHSVDMVSLLLAAQANPNILDRWNYSPLMYAAIYYDPYTVDKLFLLFIQHGCDVNLGLTLNANGHIDTGACSNLAELRLQLDGRFVAYTREPLGPTSGTSLHLAATNPHLPSQTLEILLRAGADVGKRNIYGQTPIVGAIVDIFYDYHRHIKSHAELLLRKGSDPNCLDLQGWSPLHYACQRGNVSCIEMLLVAGADCNIHNPARETPLWLLLVYGWQEAARLLVMNGCHLNISMATTTILALSQNVDVCRYGEILPVEFAICNRYYDVARLLVQAGCVVTETTWLGSSVQQQGALNSEHRHLVDFIVAHKRAALEAPSLLSACRSVIRDSLHSAICKKVDQLQLPQAIKDYIAFKS